MHIIDMAVKFLNKEGFFFRKVELFSLEVLFRIPKEIRREHVWQMKQR